MNAICTWPENGIEYGARAARPELTPDMRGTSKRYKICGIAEYKPKRFNDRLPVGDLLALGRGLDIPIADLRAAIRYQ